MRCAEIGCWCRRLVFYDERLAVASSLDVSCGMNSAKALFCILCVIALEGALAWSAEDSRPNVLFILSDDLNAEGSGMGHPQCRTPHLDRLAEESVRFTRAFCQFPLCAPSRASMMTGQYPLKNGVGGNGGRVDVDRVTLPKHFANHGYWTARVSKVYHMGIPVDIIEGTSGLDHAPSWTEAFNVPALETMTPGKIVDFTNPEGIAVFGEERVKWTAAQANGTAYTMPGPARGQYAVVEVAEENAGLLPDAMATDRAIDLLRARAADARPFFLAVGLVRPHFPFVSTEGTLSPYAASTLSVPEVPEGDHADIPKQSISAVLRFDRQVLQELRRGYYGAITFMDRQVGRLLGELDRLGLREKTIVVFVSDHGYLLGEHHMWKKNLLWEEAIRGPLMIDAPGFPGGRAVDHVVELVDLYPTIAALAGLSRESGTQGHSLVPLMKDPEARLDRADALIQTGSGFGLRRGRWAYMWYPASKKHPAAASMLYDMETDPQQYTNLSGQEVHRAIETELHARLMERIDGARR